MMKSETREMWREGGREGEMREAGQGRGDGDEQIMKRLGWSGREGEKDGIKVGMEVTVDDDYLQVRRPGRREGVRKNMNGGLRT